MFEPGLERGAGSHIDPVSGSHGQPEKGSFCPQSISTNHGHIAAG